MKLKFCDKLPHFWDHVLVKNFFQNTFSPEIGSFINSFQWRDYYVTCGFPGRNTKKFDAWNSIWHENTKVSFQMKSSIFMMFVRSSVGVILFRNLILIECRVRVESSKIITISKGGVHIETSKILMSCKEANSTF